MFRLLLVNPPKAQPAASWQKGKDKGRWSVGIKFCWLLNEFCRVVAWD